MPAAAAAHSSQGLRIGGEASFTIKRGRTAWHPGDQRNSVDVMETSVDGRHPAQGTEQVRRVPWSPRAWAQAVRVAAGIVIQLALWGLLFLIVVFLVSRPSHHWQSALLVFVVS